MLRWPARRQRRRASVAAGSTVIALSVAALSPVTAAHAASTPTPPAPGKLSSAQATQLAKGRQSGVIVMLKNQHPDLRAKSQLGRRKSQTAQDQTPFLKELKQVKATKVTSYSLVNGFAANVTQAEADRLAADPAVASVSPQVRYTLPKQTFGTTKPAKASAAKATKKDVTGSQVCPSDPAKPLLEPEALQLSHTAYTDPTLPQASKYATGKGVKVAFIADGLDINNPDFVRADGSHVFFDYQNFSGGGDKTGGAEAFGDASSIAAQGRVTYDLSKYESPAYPEPPGCTINVRGMAPDVQLAGLNIFGGNASVSDSMILQAIDWAVVHDNVDVLNESIGGGGIPMTNEDDVVQANDAAVAAGVTVVASTGDSGPTGTIGSPAEDPHIIAAGGSTAFRVLAQNGWGGFPLSNGKYVSNNIGTFASGGTTQEGRGPDLVAPAERGWAACSTDVATYSECVTEDGRPTNVFPFGGTSESSPLIAGEAALVIQAYEQTHNGARPSPDLTKRIITSTATDLGDPADEQGAGEFNALAAVQAAMSIKDSNGSPSPTGSGLVLSSSQLREHAPAGSSISDSFTVTNTSPLSQQVSAAGRTLGSPSSVDHATVQLNATDTSLPTFPDTHFNPPTRAYVKRTFTVPAGADYLNAAIAHGEQPGHDRTYEPQITLLDPQGTFTAESYSGTGNGYASVDVHNPAPGTWTEIFSTAAGTGFNGAITSDVTVRSFKAYGSVSPSSLTLAPGQTATLHVSAPAGPANGDVPASVQLTTPTHLTTSLPLLVRPDITVGNANGKFTGALSGVNGSGGPQSKGYDIDVPQGVKNLSLSVKVPTNQVVFGTLVDPSGQAVSNTINLFTDSQGNQSLTGALQLYRMTPTPGRWLFALLALNPANGSVTTLPFSGQLSFNTISASAKGLPTSKGTTLPAGKATTATITLKNSGITPTSFFADGRLDTRGALPLIPGSQATNVPLEGQGGSVSWLVPTQTSGVQFTGASSVPIMLDAGYGNGTPQLYGPPNGDNTATIVAAAHEFVAGPWSSGAALAGPQGSKVVTATANFTATVYTKLFDSAVTSTTGDYWAQTVNPNPPAFAPVSLQPGTTGTIQVTITPNAPKGTVVSGTVYLDDVNVASAGGDELMAFPYTYTVG